MAGIPGIKQIPFYHKKWILELVGSLASVVVVFISSFLNFRDEDIVRKNWGIVGFVVVGLLVIYGVFKVVQALKQDKEEQEKYDYDGLKASLTVLHELMSKLRGLSEAEKQNGRLRITIHTVVGDKNHNEELEQLIPYIGGSGGEEGRRFSIRSGIIGKALREKKAIAASRQNDDYEAFIQEMVSEWAYPEKEARKLSPDRKSWMALPILLRGGVAAGVIYLDSNERDFFSKRVERKEAEEGKKQVNELQELIISSSLGIASYIKERYR